MMKVIKRFSGRYNLIAGYTGRKIVKIDKETNRKVSEEIEGISMTAYDVSILKHLLRKREPLRAQDIQFGLGKTSLQYVHQRLAYMVKGNVLYKPDWGKYDIYEHLKEEILLALKEDPLDEKELEKEVVYVSDDIWKPL